MVASILCEGLLSYLNARRTADDLSAQVLEQTSERIGQQIEKLLDTAAAQDALSQHLPQRAMSVRCCSRGDSPSS